MAELREIIETHRVIAHPERIGKRIERDELETVDVALAQAALPPAERLERCREVSALAVRDARQKGQARATLRYAFGEGWFVERLARLREQLESAKRRKKDQALSVALGFSPRPLAKTHSREPLHRPITADEIERRLAANG